MLPAGLDTLSTTNAEVAQVIQSALAPVFLLTGIGSFLNVCVGRLARIVDRARSLEPLVLASRGQEHDTLIAELRLCDRRSRVVNAAISVSVGAAVLVCIVVSLLFAGRLVGLHFGTTIALLFILAMISTGLGFGLFLYETRLATRAVRVRAHFLDHRADDSSN